MIEKLDVTVVGKVMTVHPGMVIIEGAGIVLECDEDVVFDLPNKPYQLVAVVNQSFKPMTNRRWIFPRDKSSYSRKRSWWHRLLGLTRKPVVPPRSARLVVVTGKIDSYQYMIG